MPDFIFHLILTANATSWMLVVYGIKEHWNFWIFSARITGMILLLIPIVLSLFSIMLTDYLGTDKLHECRECVLADHEFLPVYLGYFFVALSIGDCTTLLFVYLIVFVFTFITQTQYFNPIFLLLGYHFYYIMTGQGTRIFVIVKGRVIRNLENIEFTNLGRINDTTYILRKDKEYGSGLCENSSTRREE